MPSERYNAGGISRFNEWPSCDAPQRVPSQVTEADLQEAAVALLKSMELREKYMKASLQRNGRVAKRYLKLVQSGTQEELRDSKKNLYYVPQSSNGGISRFFKPSVILFVEDKLSVKNPF